MWIQIIVCGLESDQKGADGFFCCFTVYLGINICVYMQY